jgi:steroid delta-isomerase-like uncharacterized protein
VVGEPNHVRIRRYLEEGLGKGDEAVVAELRAPDIAWHGGALGEARGVEELERLLRPVHEAFPDLSVSVEELFGDGDLVVARSTVSGTHRGSFLGVPATDLRVTWPAIAIYRLEGGRIAEQWLCEDWTSFLQQVGALPREV